MNGRDTAQMLFVMNWDLRQTAQRLGLSAIPLEPPATTAESHVDGDGSAADDGDSGSAAAPEGRPGTPSEVAPAAGGAGEASAAAPGGGDD